MLLAFLTDEPVHLSIPLPPEVSQEAVQEPSFCVSPCLCIINWNKVLAPYTSEITPNNIRMDTSIRSLRAKRKQLFLRRFNKKVASLIGFHLLQSFSKFRMTRRNRRKEVKKIFPFNRNVTFKASNAVVANFERVPDDE